VRYGAVVAVDGLDIEAEAGEVVAVLGRNGAGKTSTVETLEGYRPPAAGRVRVLGLDPADRSDHRTLAKRAGVMLQQGGVYPAMSARQALTLFASYYDDPLPPADLIGRLGLGPVASTPWRRLSGGEQQRLSLALALIGRPDVAFLDEPTAGVDPAGRVAIRNEISSLRDRGVCVLLTTHELQEAERIANRIVIIDRGRLLASGSAAELTAAAGPEGPHVRFAAPAGIDVIALGDVLGQAIREEAPGEYLVAAPSSPALVAALATWLAERNLPLTDLRSGRRSLEEVFLALTADADQDRELDDAGHANESGEAQ
jgi:ABC-2 type transport system ATP-binding protein